MAVTNTVTGAATRFVYDGDGRRVLRIGPAGTTVYLGDIYEEDVATGAATAYYYASGRRVAMRAGGVIYYLHSDHLGSTSLATTAGGAVVPGSRTGYDPYGAVRYGGALPTDFTFTGQRAEGFGLYDYRARWYDPALGRFVSADTVVPEPGNPQGLNRYAYVTNNPLRYTDPSGHIEADEAEKAREIIAHLADDYGIVISVDFGWRFLPSAGDMEWVAGVWQLAELETIAAVAGDMAGLMGGPAAFRDNLGGVLFEKGDLNPGYIGLGGEHHVTLSLTAWNASDQWTVAHELAHSWDAVNGWQLSVGLEAYTGGWTEEVGDNVYVYHPGGTPPKAADDNFTRAEDFAESVATFLYPGIAHDFIEQHSPDDSPYRYLNYYRLRRATYVAMCVGYDPQQLRFRQMNWDMDYR